jgi:uncharacterized protein (DUF4415 family)
MAIKKTIHNKKKPGRPKQGKTNKEYCAVRIQKHIKNKITRLHNGVQKWVDIKIKNEFGE